jgi:hypothetical protein
MGKSASTTATATAARAATPAPAHRSPAGADPATRFLVELDNAWTMLRLYGTEHPALRRSAEAAAAAIEKSGRVSIDPRGFSVGKKPVDNHNLTPLAHRLRAMGLVGLATEPGLTPAQVVSLVLVLNEADRSRGSADAVVEKVSAATGGHVRVVPLRLDALRLVEGTADLSGGPTGSDGWREMFASAFFAGAGDSAASAELARAFENALRGQTSDHWDAMIGVWMRQIASIDPAAPPSSGTGIGTGSGGAAPEPALEGAAPSLDAVATFMGALSPVLCQRLLKETVSAPAVSERVVLALAERLPAGLVLGALAAVDKTNREPSMAALALLRKMSANVPGAEAHATTTPATRADLAEVAAALEKLLGANNEHQFVPEEYLQRRQELSHHALSAGDGRGVAYPAEYETARHAAGLAFDILATPEATHHDLTSALAFVTDRVSTWIRTGEFALAREAIALASNLTGHDEPAVSKPAQAIVSASVNADDLIEGARHRTGRADTIVELAALLRQSDGITLATLLSSVKPAAHDPVIEALRRSVPELPAATMQALFKAISSTPPPALLAVLTSLKEPDAIKAVHGIVPHAAGATRCAVVHVIFRRDFRWPMPLIDRLLCDDEPEIRRLAVMKLVSDLDLAAAANVLAAASKKGKYEPDVALGLAELLRHHRHHPDVRAGWRTWMWSKRWWSALLFVNIGTPRRAA